MSKQATVVGLGRMGTALALSLARAGWDVRGWSPTQRGRELQGVEVSEGGRPSTSGAEVVLVAAPDRLVAEATEQLVAAGAVAPGQVVAHASGSLGLAPLAAAAAAGAEVGSLHPLLAAAPGTDSLAGNWAAVDGTDVARDRLTALARDVGLHPFHVPEDQRVRYHAAASLAANGAVALASLAAGVLGQVGLPPAQALAALLPLLSSALAGLERVGLPQGLTGPVARGDVEVVRRHLQALAGDEAEAAYRALSLHALTLARGIGEASPAALDDIEALLREG